MTDLLHFELTETILKCAYEVHNELGSDFLEKVYENALVAELRVQGICCVQQKPIPVLYKGLAVGDYFADLFIEDLVIVELKAVEMIASQHEIQLKHYLRATSLEVGLLINFGRKVEICRKFVSKTQRNP